MENYFYTLQQMVNDDLNNEQQQPPKVSWVREEEILGVKVRVHFDDGIHYITDLKKKYIGIAESLEEAKLQFANDLGYTQAKKEWKKEFNKKLKKAMKW